MISYRRTPVHAPRALLRIAVAAGATTLTATPECYASPEAGADAAEDAEDANPVALGIIAGVVPMPHDGCECDAAGAPATDAGGVPVGLALAAAIGLRRRSAR
jgi:hypothetical protein